MQDKTVKCNVCNEEILEGLHDFMCIMNAIVVVKDGYLTIGTQINYDCDSDEEVVIDMEDIEEDITLSDEYEEIDHITVHRECMSMYIDTLFMYAKHKVSKISD